MGLFNEAMGELGANSFRAIPKNETDYYDKETGLLVCGECNTPKEALVEMFGRTMKVRCMCKCLSAEYERREEEEARQQRRLWLKELREGAFPDESLERCTFDTDLHPECELSRVARNYVRRFPEMLKDGKGLVFFGRPGTGKTFYACCIANELLKKEYPVMVTSFSRIANTLQGMRGNVQSVIDRMSNYDLLVIDDYSVERDTGFMMETVFNVIDFRIKSGKPMIVTTNMSRDQMRIQGQTNLDKTRVISRLFQTCVFFEAKGEDMRAKILRQDDSKYRNMLLEDDEDE